MLVPCVHTTSESGFVTLTFLEAKNKHEVEKNRHGYQINTTAKKCSVNILRRIGFATKTVLVVVLLKFLGNLVAKTANTSCVWPAVRGIRNNKGIRAETLAFEFQL